MGRKSRNARPSKCFISIIGEIGVNHITAFSDDDDTIRKHNSTEESRR